MNHDRWILEIARVIYADLILRAVPNIADWRACELWNLSASDLHRVVAVSRGHLRLRRPGILEAVKPTPTPTLNPNPQPQPGNRE